MAKAKILKMDLPDSWTSSPETMAFCMGQIRGSVRAMSRVTDRKELEPLLCLTNAMDIALTMGPRQALRLLQRGNVSIGVTGGHCGQIYIGKKSWSFWAFFEDYFIRT
jgi:hypothetical protein